MSSEKQPEEKCCEFCTTTADFFRNATPEQLAMPAEEVAKVITEDVQVDENDMDVGC